MTARPIILTLALSACAPATATLQAQCAGFGYTDRADIAGCTERRHDKAIERQFAAARIVAGAVSAGMLADALTGLGNTLAGLELPDIAPVFDVKLPRLELCRDTTAPRRVNDMAVTFSQDVFDTICERIANGESLVAILSDDDMPSYSTFMRWLEADDGNLRDRYAREREVQAIGFLTSAYLLLVAKKAI